ncbi:MAG: ATP-binding protein, partial [Anaerolineae bacterium]|nr:ATP-binding protein [Anaerolineae bacterium]
HYAPERAHFIIRVRDHGRGMTREQIEQIGAYMQFNRKLYEQQGSGMGLIVARRLAEIHHGGLHMDSPIDGGLYVTIRLPLAQPASH